MTACDRLIEKTRDRKIEKGENKSYFGNVPQDDPSKMVCPARRWTKRAGIIAFIFFLGKGLFWLGIAAVGAYYTFN